MTSRYEPNSPSGMHHRGGFTPLTMAPNDDKPTTNDEESDDTVATSSPSEKEQPKLNPKIIKEKFSAFREMAWPYYAENKSGRWLFAGMIGLTLMNSGVSVAFSYLSRDFWTALSSKDVTQFWMTLGKFCVALLAGTPVAVLYSFQRQKLALAWREWMTDRTLQLYYSNRVYYSLERGGEIDNPDQRIAEDVRSFTAFSLTFFITIITSVIDLCSFSFILYSIQPNLFVAIVGYAAFGTIITTLIGKKLVGLNFMQLQKEADFRYSLVRIRENAESIAFYGGEDIEGKEVSKRLNKVISNKKDLIKTERNLDFFTTAYRYLIQVFPIAVVAPQYFSGAIQLGVISQTVGAFNHILNDLSVIVNQFESLSTFVAGIDRLHQFMLAIKKNDPDRASPDLSILDFANATATTDRYTSTSEAQDELDLEPGIQMTPMTAVSQTPDQLMTTIDLKQVTDSAISQPLISIQKLCLYTPDLQRLLIQDLTLSMNKGDHLLIVGNSGAGKSSLLRAIAGLWTSGSGSIRRPCDADVYFLPQRPYCALGSLKDQLLYPSLTDKEMDPEIYPPGHKLSKAHLLKQSLSDEDLLYILEQVDLQDLPCRFGLGGDPHDGLNTVRDWSNTLSLGEQQRLAFGRLLVNKPRLVILDEATSALDMESEAKMYKLLQDMTSYDSETVTFVSVGHRPSLLDYHNVKLRLNKDDYALESIENASVSSNVFDAANM